MTARRWASRCWYSLCWCACWAISKVYFRYQYRGRKHVPTTGPLLVVSNHQSHLDPVLVGVACPRQLRALARHTLFFWPLSWLIRSLGAVPIERGGGVAGIKTILKLLREGDAVLVFPEGTRTRDGELQPLQGGFAAIARRSGASIIPAAISGAFAAMPRGTSFPRPRPIAAIFGKAITPAEIGQMSDEDLVQQLAERIVALQAELREQPAAIAAQGAAKAAIGAQDDPAH
jgi:1-acyl-sn-glycerol-3-phosphate acyltransferase